MLALLLPLLLVAAVALRRPEPVHPAPASGVRP
jgi:hypothetical protein